MNTPLLIMMSVEDLSYAMGTRYGCIGPVNQGPDCLRGYDAELIPSHIGVAPVSAYSTFLRCPRCAYLIYVQRRRLPKTKFSIRGLLHHEAFEWLLSREYRFAGEFSLLRSDEEMLEVMLYELESIRDRCLGKFQGQFKLLTANYEVEWGHLVIQLTKAYLHWVKRLRLFASQSGLEGIDLAKAFVPFRQFEVMFSAPALGVSGGKVDVVENGIPLEIKTGRAPEQGIPSDHALQLVWYALLIEYSTGGRVDYAQAYYTQVQQRRILSADKEKRLWALRVRDAALKVFQRSEPPQSSCYWCSSLSRDECLA